MDGVSPMGLSFDSKNSRSFRYSNREEPISLKKFNEGIGCMNPRILQKNVCELQLLIQEKYLLDRGGPLRWEALSCLENSNETRRQTELEHVRPGLMWHMLNSF